MTTETLYLANKTYNEINDLELAKEKLPYMECSTYVQELLKKYLQQRISELQKQLDEL